MANVVRGDQPSTPDELTAAAVASFDGCSDERLRTIMQALVRHLHAFAREVGLTQEEWQTAIGILTATRPHHRRAAAGVHPLVGHPGPLDARRRAGPPGPARATESTVLGPFYVPASPRASTARTSPSEPAGEPAWVHGRVLDLDGRPIAGAELDVWQNGDDRLYAVQDPRRPRTTCAAASARAPTARTRSWPYARCRTRFPTTGRWARCSPRPAATPGARRTST